MRRGKAPGEAGKAQRPKTARSPTRHKAKRSRSSAAAEKKTSAARFRRERDEALEQQATTAEILSLISKSPTDTQPVFEAIVQSGLKLFPNAAILIALPDGDRLRAAAIAETDPARAKKLLSRWPIPLSREYMHAIAILDRRIIDIPDAREAPPEFSAAAKYFLTTGYRAITTVPLMRGGDAIGALSVVRSAPGALSDKQVAVLKTFTDQAVIAIENTRLLNELRESLEQQTATSEVLQVISSSAGDLNPVFKAMLEKAVRICDANFGMLFRIENDAVSAAAMFGVPPKFAEFWQGGPRRPGLGTALG